MILLDNRIESLRRKAEKEEDPHITKDEEEERREPAGGEQTVEENKRGDTRGGKTETGRSGETHRETASLTEREGGREGAVYTGNWV